MYRWASNAQEPREPPFRWLRNEIAVCFFAAVHHVLSDISGASGLTLLAKILGGERDPVALAHPSHARVSSPREKTGLDTDDRTRSLANDGIRIRP